MEHKTISIAEQIFEQLEREILSGAYPRGELLTETKLSEKLGVSRTPIREALRRLDQEHIIKMTTKGAFVLGITKQDIDDIYEIRSRIEGLAAKLAAERATDEEIAELKNTVELQEFYTLKQDADNIKNMDSTFHRLMYHMSGSTPLYDTLEPLHKRIIKYRKASISSQTRAHESMEEHKAIYEAIAAHDGELAEKLVNEHVRKAQASIARREIK
ncbi:MAG: GntR family transcriptional regulator [Clostridiales bacterium]|nr:MAG: GntR family transcriptional regulator [Clostridiales bacterium]